MIPPFRQSRNSTLKSQHLLSQQVQWQNPAIEHAGIDQTRLAIADAPTSNQSAFSFLVIGDTDAGGTLKGNDSFSAAFSRQIAEHLKESRFIIHTGDIAYPSGNYHNYFTHFLHPYQALLTQLPHSPSYKAQDIVFNKALLSVPGNHDYSCDSTRFRYWSYLLRQVCDRLRTTLNIDLGHYGGEFGEAYGQTFLDNLAHLSAEQLTAHLATHYSAQETSAQETSAQETSAQRNIASEYPTRHYLSYRPGSFTRLPNRYYSFRYGGIDFFALDSNTWNTAPDKVGFDQAQLSWLKNSLIRSWETTEVIGRVVYLHHSPYTTENCHWQKAETLWVRRHLRKTFHSVAQAVGLNKTTRKHASIPPVDLVLSGHAHCFEHLTSKDSGLGDQGIDWIVCGGSGAEIRRQRSGETDILERVATTQIVAKSHRFVGHHGRSQQSQSFHSFLRVDIQPSCAQKITIQPFVVSQVNNRYKTKALSPIAIGQNSIAISAVVA